MQIFFAENWLEKIWFTAFVGVSVVLHGLMYFPAFAIDHSIVSYGLFVIVLILIGGIAYLVSLIVGCMILPPVFRWRENVNGSPFHIGDQVEILKGSRRGEVVEVYDVWSPRFEARLSLGDKASEDFTDVYSFTAFRKSI